MPESHFVVPNSVVGVGGGDARPVMTASFDVELPAPFGSSTFFFISVSHAEGHAVST